MVSVRIPLLRGGYASVSIQDAERIMKYKWRGHGGYRGKEYAVTTLRRKTVQMHRLLRPDVTGEIDHRNRNRLDNCRSSLRPATRSQNAANAAPFSAIGYKGVIKEKNRVKCYRACIHYNGKNKYLGRFLTATDAARAYNTAASECFGEFAYLNVIDEGVLSVSL